MTTGVAESIGQPLKSPGRRLEKGPNVLRSLGYRLTALTPKFCAYLVIAVMLRYSIFHILDVASQQNRIFSCLSESRVSRHRDCILRHAVRAIDRLRKRCLKI